MHNLTSLFFSLRTDNEEEVYVVDTCSVINAVDPHDIDYMNALGKFLILVPYQLFCKVEKARLGNWSFPRLMNGMTAKAIFGRGGGGRGQVLIVQHNERISSVKFP